MKMRHYGSAKTHMTRLTNKLLWLLSPKKENTGITGAAATQVQKISGSKDQISPVEEKSPQVSQITMFTQAKDRKTNQF